MPARDDSIRCVCPECTVSAGLNSAGLPVGVFFPSRRYTAHVNRVNRARRQPQPPPDTTPDHEVGSPHSDLGPVVSERQDSAEALTASMLFLALTDDGPDIHSQPNKLWTSREE